MPSQKDESKVKSYYKMIAASLRQQYVSKHSVVILVGSQARNKLTWRSDVDFLVITPIHIRRPKMPIDAQLHLATRSDFLKKCKEGNDFEAWALKFGELYSDPSGWWQKLQRDGKWCKWPDWRQKITHALKRHAIAEQLLVIGDHAASEEEYLMAFAHIARALLFKVGVFPLSRPEMPAQLRDIGLEEDARVLENLINGTQSLDELKKLADWIDIKLKQLDQLANSTSNTFLPDNLRRKTPSLSE